MEELRRHTAESAGSPAPGATLRSALRLARIEDAERSTVVAELRGAEIARLEMLADAMQPVLAEVPDGIDLFDVGLAPGPQPRLFIDMIGFVEMGRDRRLYRFVQDTRHGRTVLAESERTEAMVEAIRTYVARRLLEREKALAADATYRGQVAPAAGPASAPPAHRAPAPQKATWRRIWTRSFRFLIEFLGSIALFGLLALGGWFVLKYAFALWAAHQGAQVP